VTGKINENTVKSLNNTAWEKFKQIAINLDRYKLLPDTLPQKFIWVNIPSYYMQLIDNDTVVFKSRIVVGKPDTRTPSLTSRITDMITYPQWTIPTSIIVKEVLPGVKKNPDYFVKHGYSLLDKKGEEVDPHTVDWRKYTKGIPYKVIQGSGDANALGILKFNFSNKYSVYMHDTNQRYLFSNASRSLSHGCIRVQEWQKLANYLIRLDSLNRKPPHSANFIGSDSLKVWLVRKEKHYLPVRNRLPVFIRYFSCEGANGKVKFYEDIYGEDKTLRERYFADKSIQ
jgi:murein L,D-transpeptidase YcbB/YkuD